MTTDLSDLADAASTPEAKPDARPADEDTFDVLAEGGTPEGAIAILRRGLAASPELHNGLAITLLMGLSVAMGKLVIPVLIERILNQVAVADDGSVIVDSGKAVPAILITLVIIFAATQAVKSVEKLFAVKLEFF